MSPSTLFLINGLFIHRLQCQWGRIGHCKYIQIFNFCVQNELNRMEYNIWNLADIAGWEMYIKYIGRERWSFDTLQADKPSAM